MLVNRQRGILMRGPGRSRDLFRICPGLRSGLIQDPSLLWASALPSGHWEGGGEVTSKKPGK